MDIAFFRAALDSMREGICFANPKGMIIYWNKSAERLTGYTEQEILGRSCTDEILLHLNEVKGTLASSSPIAATIADEKTHEIDAYLRHKYGHRVSMTTRSSPVRGKKKSILGAVEVFSCNIISLNMISEIEILRKETLRDELTDIGNRKLAESIMQTLVTTFETHDIAFGVLFVDIDHFKNINDSWGHKIGDNVLCMVAHTLVNGLRGLDVACRFGGDEFLLLIPNIQKEPLEHLGERLRGLIENSWLEYNDHRIRVTASFGGAISREGETPSEIVGRADQQAYRSKQAGRNCVSLDAVNAA